MTPPVTVPSMTQDDVRGSGHISSALILVILCGGLPLSIAALGPYRSVWPYVAGVVVQLCATAWTWGLIRRWRRPGRPATPRDAWVPGLLLGASAGAYVVGQLLAQGYGIQGSAYPRLRSGIAWDLDIAYLAACVAITTTVLGALVLGGLMAWTRGRSAWEQVQARPPAPRAPRPAVVLPSYATRPEDGPLRRLVSPSTWVVLGLGVLLAFGGVWLAATGAPQQALLGATVVVLAPVPVVCWSALQSLWRPDQDAGIVVAALIRTMAVPVLASVVQVVLTALVGALTPLRASFDQQRWPDHSWEGLLPTGAESLLGWLGFTALTSLFFAMLAGLATVIGVLLPAAAIWRPDQLISENMMSTKRSDRESNILAVRLIAVLVPVVIVAVSLIVVARSGGGAWWLGIALAGAAVVLTGLIWSRQRVDHARRARWGVNGVANPNDPRK